MGVSREVGIKVLASAKSDDSYKIGECKRIELDRPR